MDSLVEELKGLRSEIDVRWSGRFAWNVVSLIDRAVAHIGGQEAELLEQASLLGKGAEREAQLLARVEELERVAKRAEQYLGEQGFDENHSVRLQLRQALADMEQADADQ